MVLVAPATPAHATVRWTPTELSRLDVSRTGNPINRRGVIVGNDHDSAESPHFGTNAEVWDPVTRTRTRLQFGYAASAAVDVNDSDLVVGWGGGASADDFPEQLWTWKVGDSAPRLIQPADSDDFIAWDPASVNNSGMVVGTSNRGHGDFVRRATQWDTRQANPEPHELGSLGGPDAESRALSITNTGYVVGQATNRAGYTRPFLYLPEKKTMIDLGVLPGYDSGVAHDMNDRSYVVGESFRRSDPSDRRAWVWSPVTHRLIALESAGPSAAYAINRYGVVVGQETGRAAIWDECLPRPGHLEGLAGRAVNQTSQVAVDVSDDIGPIGSTIGLRWTRTGTCAARSSPLG